MALAARQRWFAHCLHAGLEEKIFGPAQLLAHATPEVLAQHLPPEILTKVIQTSLTAGAMTADRVLETLTPEVLVEHVPLEILWTCISVNAERAGIASPDKSA